MGPTRQQRWIADNWPCRLMLAGGTLGSMAMFAGLYGPLAGDLGRPSDALKFGYFTLVAGVLGFCVTAAVAVFVLGPVYHGQGLDNGAPYERGDRVRVLRRGKYRDRVGIVYEIWPERDRVRVDLGEAGREEARDVFRFFEVCRVPGARDARPGAGDGGTLAR